MTKKVNLQQQELKTRSTQVIIALIAAFIIIAVVKALALFNPTEASTEEKGNTPPSVFSWVPDIESGTLKCQNEEGREDKS